MHAGRVGVSSEATAGLTARRIFPSFQWLSKGRWSRHGIFILAAILVARMESGAAAGTFDVPLHRSGYRHDGYEAKETA